MSITVFAILSEPKKITGVRLLPSDKYTMTEFLLSDYAWQMNLTIHDLEKRDFGGYACSAVNALGSAENVVRLQGEDKLTRTKHPPRASCFRGQLAPTSSPPAHRPAAPPISPAIAEPGATGA